MSNEQTPRPPQLDALPKSLQPQRDLWPGIAQRLPARAPARRRPWIPMSLAASVLLTALLGFVLRNTSVNTAPPFSTLPAVSTAAPATDWSDVEVRGVQISARSLRTLRGGWAQDLPSVEDEEQSGLMKAAYRPGAGFAQNSRPQRSYLRAHLRLIEQAEREVRRALREQPASTGLQELLQTAQQKREHLQNLIDAQGD